MKDVYLDYNATAPVRPEVIDAVTATMKTVGNPSSVHGAGRRAKNLLEKAREQVASLVGARARDVVFTSGGTEANNQALRLSGSSPLFVSAIEHDSILQAAKGATLLSVDSCGRLDLASFEKHLSKAEGAFVSVMTANNETGVLQPLKEIAEIVHHQSGFLHTDAVQAAGKMIFDKVSLGVDALSLSSHKLGGPQGVGALVLGPGIDCPSLLKGGGQERSKRAGTENVAGIVGFGLAAEMALNEISKFQKLAELKNRLEVGLKQLSNSLVIFSEEAERTVNTTNFAWPGLTADKQLINLDLASIAVSSGSACSSGKVKLSHVLSAMGVTEKLAGSAIRVSLGWNTKAEDVDSFLNSFCKLVKKYEGIEGSTAA